MKLLIAHEAKFLLIGGYAVNAFGYIRNTIDLDVWIAGDPGNQKCVISAVREFGFPAATSDIFEEANSMLRMGVPPLRIEVIRSISGVEFEDCWQRRVYIEDDEITIPMISLADLKKNKKASGRTKDLADLEELS